MVKIQPMLAETGTPEALTLPDWIYEPKIDGCRCVANLDGGTLLTSRTGKTIGHRFPELAKIHKQVKKSCILDGEVAGVNFNAIQHRIGLENPFKIKLAQKQYPAIYYAFDVLYVAGESVKHLPLVERKKILKSILVPDNALELVKFYLDGEKLLKQSKRQGQEGIMGKDMYGAYYEGKRSKVMLKLKNFREAVFFICGATVGENARSDSFGSLILANKVGGKLNYVGNVGSGFTNDMLATLMPVLKSRKAKCPFTTSPDVDRPVLFWTKPILKCEVRYLPDGLEIKSSAESGGVNLPVLVNNKLRFPTFRRMVK